MSLPLLELRFAYIIVTFVVVDFDDMSCEMIYGQAPPAFEDDPATKQPCLADICKCYKPQILHKYIVSSV